MRASGGAAIDRAVLFDFGGTLDANAVSWKRRFFGLFSEEGVTAAPDAFDRCFYTADDALVAALSPASSLRETVERLTAGVADRLAWRDDAAIARVAGRFLAEARESLRESAALLSRLAPRYRLGVVSNFYGNLHTVCEETGLARHLGVVVDSTRAGVLKPDPRIFRLALDALGVSDTLATFIGDSFDRDMQGARAAGLRHAWLVGDSDPARPPCCPGDAVLRRLQDLEAVLP